MSRVEGSLLDNIVLIEQAGERAVKGVSDILQDGGNDVRDTAREYAPMDTGALRNSIVKNTEYTGVNRRAVVTISFGEDLPYAEGVNEHMLDYGDGEPFWGESKLGGETGGRFLERAWAYCEGKIIRRADKLIKKVFE